MGFESERRRKMSKKDKGNVPPDSNYKVLSNIKTPALSDDDRARVGRVIEKIKSRDAKLLKPQKKGQKK